MSSSFDKYCRLAALLLAAALLVSCGAGVRATVYVPGPPPAAASEMVIVSPGEGYVWIPGYHRWESGSYVWIAGRWERPPHPHGRWEEGRWKHSGKGWYWVEGRWR